MRVTGKITDSSIDFLTGKPKLSFEINEKNDFKILVDELGEKDKLLIEVKPFRKKRSLDACAYAWVLIDKLAKKLNIGKEALYREYIRNIGGNSAVACVKDEAVEALCDAWRRIGIGWQTEIFSSKIEGCTNVILYKGSSEYDTAQMSRLLDMIIQDCREQGIPTETPDQLANMISLWRTAK